MKFGFGQLYTFKLENGNRLDISVYQHKWFTTVRMNVWEEKNPYALCDIEKIHFNYERIMPKKWAEIIVTYVVNRQSQKVANINLIK